jgi:hypothetical protein
VALPKEDEILVGGLKPGDVYPGRYDGAEFTVDGNRNVKNLEGRMALNPQAVPALVKAAKGQAGRFRVTPRNRAILVRIPVDEDSWHTVYAGTLREDFRFDEPQSSTDFDPASLTVGDPYPGPAKGVLEVRYRQRGGGTLTRRVPGGEAYARGPDAERLLAAVQVARVSEAVTRIVVNELGHAFWWDAGRPRFLTALDGQLAFPAEAKQ